MKISHSSDYSKRRKAEYPRLEEFADAFVKLQNGDPAPMQAYVERCNAVKAKHPKRARPDRTK
jgi:hypothetical protein